MKRTLTVALATLVLVAGLSGPVAAQPQERETRGVDELVAGYNEHVAEAPGFVTAQLAGEQVEIAVHTADGDARYYHATLADDGRITEYGTGPSPAPDVRVTTDARTLETIRSAEHPSDRAAAAYESGAISVQGVGAVDSVRVTAVQVAATVGESLGLV